MFKNSLYSICTFLLLALTSTCYAQGNAFVTVENYTGAARVVVPIYTVSSGQLSMPIGIVYDGSGVKVKDVEGTAGLGWNVAAGGEVVRKLRGLPDDIKFDNSGQNRLGWLHNNNGTKINNFTILNNNSMSDCADETADNTYITNNFNDLSDTEPDLFQVNAPGLSFQFVFDNNHQIKVFPYQDLNITYTSDAGGQIISLKVVSENGTVYVFSKVGTETRKAQTSAAVSYFKRTYDQFLNGVTFNWVWKLTEMTGENGSGIYLSYNQAGVRYVSEPINLAFPNSSVLTMQYNLSRRISTPCVTNISSSVQDILNPIVELEYAKSPLRKNGVPYIVTISAPSGVSSFNYLTTTHNALSNNRYRIVLKDFNANNKHFDLKYNGVTSAEGYTVTEGILALPDSTSKEVDYWGYYNGNGQTSLLPQIFVNGSNANMERYRSIYPGNGTSSFPITITGVSRDASLNYAINGSLSKIIYENGGSTSIKYESNSFYDNTAGAVINGGGIRVKEIIDYDGIDSTKNIKMLYNYDNPVNGISSGRIITMPSFAFTIPYSGTGTDAVRWTNSTVRSADDLSAESHRVVYGYVSRSQPGLGFTRNKYSVPATAWDQSWSSDWMPTMINSGRVNCSGATLSTNAINSYPFVPNPNYDFERGLLESVSVFNSANQLVSEELYSYQRSFPITAATGFKFDANTAASRNYAKYQILTGTSELLAQTVQKKFDMPGGGAFQAVTTTYNYASPNHKRLTSTQITNSDGRILRNFIKYVKDYSPVLGADSMSNALYYFKNRNINLPVESYSQSEYAGINKTIGASLTMYKNYRIYFNNYLPSQSLKLIAANGLTDYQISSVNNGSFIRDSRYQVISNNIVYNESGELQSVDDNKRNIVTTLQDQINHAPVVVLGNALAKEVAVDNFDNFLGTGFQYTDTANVADARSGQVAIALKPTSSMSRVITRNSLATNYIFSVWVKSAGTGAISVQLTNSANQTTSYPLAFTNTNNTWKYLEIKTPVSALTGQFTLKIIPNANVTVDDVLFYPEPAKINMISYDRFMNKVAETDGSGRATYFDYDYKQRMLHTYNQDRDIIVRKKYLDYFDNTNYAPYISDIAPIINEQSVFSINYLSPYYELGGTTYLWNFGDGSPSSSTSAHVYTQAGTYNVQVTVSSPSGSTLSLSRSVNVGYTQARVKANKIDIGTDGYVNQLQFFLNSSTEGTYFSKDQLENYDCNVGQGTYKVRVAVIGQAYNTAQHTGFRRVYLTVDGVVVGCRPFISNSAFYEFENINLGGKSRITAVVAQDDCDLITAE